MLSEAARNAAAAAAPSVLSCKMAPILMWGEVYCSLLMLALRRLCGNESPLAGSAESGGRPSRDCNDSSSADLGSKTGRGELGPAGSGGYDKPAGLRAGGDAVVRPAAAAAAANTAAGSSAADCCAAAAATVAAAAEPAATSGGPPFSSQPAPCALSCCICCKNLSARASALAENADSSNPDGGPLPADPGSSAGCRGEI